MSKKKKIIVLSCMVALLVVTAVFNFILTDGSISTSNTVTSEMDYFEQYRAERLSNRNEEILQLDSVIASSSDSSEALSLKTELTKIIEKEFLLENLIKAYGFDDVVVVIGIDSDNINVIAKTDDLSTDDAILIYTIVNEECSVSPDNVKIIPIS